MRATPWGDAERLQERWATPAGVASRDLARRNQRRRLMGAAIAVVAERGYPATRVADLLEVGGVSRNAFYKEFANKQDCFLATLDALAKMVGRTVAEAYEQAEGSWDERLRVAFETISQLVVEQPASARFGLVEVYAAGPEALERLDRIDAEVERAVSRALSKSPAQAGMPRDIVRAVLGGLRKVLYARVREGREAELPGLVPDMLNWAISYATPSEPLEQPSTPPDGHMHAEVSPVPGDGRQRIVNAVTELVAEKGYPAMAITEIAERAAVSLSTFYLHFDGKEAAFLAALADLQRQVFDAAVPIAQAAEDWEHAVNAGLRGFFGFLATHPASARMAGVGVWATSAAGLDLRAKGMTIFNTLLDEGYRKYPDASPAAREGIGASVDALMFDCLRERGAERLYEIAPTATFIALAPFVGSERASELANVEPARAIVVN